MLDAVKEWALRHEGGRSYGAGMLGHAPAMHAIKVAAREAQGVM